MTVMTTQPSGLQSPDKPFNLAVLSAAKLWRSSTSAEIITAWKKHSSEENWPLLQKYFSKRNLQRDLAKILEEKIAPITWAIPAKYGTFLDWHKSISKQITSKNSSGSLQATISAWCDAAMTRTSSVSFALESVAWTHQLTHLAAVVDSKTWWSLVSSLISLADQASLCQVDDDSTADDYLVYELLAGELPLALSVMLPELKPTKQFAESARKKLSESLVELTDGEGLLKADLLDVSQMLLACWTRAKALGCATKKGAFSSDAETQFEWLVQQLLRLSDRNGRIPFSQESPHAALDLFSHALDLGGDASDEVAASKRLKGFKARKNDDELPEPSNDSEWAQLATLSAGWSDKSPRFTVDYSNETLRIELIFEGKTLFSGDWPIEVTRDGKQLRADDEWDVNCWHSDEDCDYLELSMDLADGSQLERLILLAREDGVAMLGEVMLGPDGAEASPVEIISRLPLGDGISLQEEDETRDSMLTTGDKPVCGIIPLALPEWRSEKRVGELTKDGDQLLLKAKSIGRNMVSPLWIDFSRTRYAKQRTWRQLTVAQSLEKVANDVAVSYRIQSGKDQWIIYRSLDERANRTVLGQNLSSEALYGRFLKTGEVDEYLEIGDDDEE